MEDLSRRQLLIAASATSAIGAIAAAPDIASAGAMGGNGGGPVLPPTPDTYRFPLVSTTLQIVRSGGSITKAVSDNFSVLENNQVSAGYLVLKPGAVREPHWHPTHWEVDYAVAGEGELGIVTPTISRTSAGLRLVTSGSLPLGGRTTPAMW